MPAAWLAHDLHHEAWKRSTRTFLPMRERESKGSPPVIRGTWTAGAAGAAAPEEGTARRTARATAGTKRFTAHSIAGSKMGTSGITHSGWCHNPNPKNSSDGCGSLDSGPRRLAPVPG